MSTAPKESQKINPPNKVYSQKGIIKNSTIPF